MPAISKAGANYMNSQLIKMEAIVNGYSEGIALDVKATSAKARAKTSSWCATASCLRRRWATRVLPGITRNSVLHIAKDLGIPLVEQVIPREMLYIADEVFFSGTAAEITPIRSVDKIQVGTGKIGDITRSIRDEFFGIVKNGAEDRYGWLTPVKQPVETR